MGRLALSQVPELMRIGRQLLSSSGCAGPPEVPIPPAADGAFLLAGDKADTVFLICTFAVAQLFIVMLLV